MAGAVAEGGTTVSGRPIHIWKTPFQRAQYLNKTTFLGFDTIRRWRWRCYICCLECTNPAATLAAIYDAALDHLKAEHLETGRP